MDKNELERPTEEDKSAIEVSDDALSQKEPIVADRDNSIVSTDTQMKSIDETSNHEFCEPTLPIKFKKPSAPIKIAVNSKSASSVSNNTEAGKPGSCERTVNIDNKIVETDTVKGIKVVPVPYKEPSWSGIPSKTYSFEVLKGGIVVGSVKLDKPFIVFGRLAQCDVMLEHPSVSRFHCIVQYRSEGNETAPEGVYVYDLNSTHGSFQNKNRLQPKVYNRLRVGHQLKFGGSTRTFLLLGPNEDEESESLLSVKELQEIARKKQEEKDKQVLLKKQEEEKKALKLKKDEEERGISWGMREDAVEEDSDGENNDPDNCDGPNPYTSMLNKEQLFLDDPKKSLRGWYEREGYDLPEYDVTEVTSGHFKVTVRLPVTTDGGEPMIASANHKGRKKDCVAQAALEACRLLDRHGMLRQATHASHERTKDAAAAAAYDSDDEDEFLDRTGDVERKKLVRGRQNVVTVTYTHEQLLEQYKPVCDELTSICDKLLEAQRCTKAQQKSSCDDLDVFMKNINKYTPDKHKMLTWKLQCNELRKNETRLRKLVNIARPFNLEPLQPPTLPAELLLPGSQPSPKTKIPPLATKSSPSVSTESTNGKGASKRVHSAFLEEEEAPKLKLTKLDSNDEGVAKPVPYDKDVYNKTRAPNRPGAAAAAIAAAAQAARVVQKIKIGPMFPAKDRKICPILPAKDPKLDTILLVKDSEIGFKCPETDASKCKSGSADITNSSNDSLNIGDKISSNAEVELENVKKIASDVENNDLDNEKASLISNKFSKSPTNRADNIDTISESKCTVNNSSSNETVEISDTINIKTDNKLDIEVSKQPAITETESKNKEDTSNEEITIKVNDSMELSSDLNGDFVCKQRNNNANQKTKSKTIASNKPSQLDLIRAAAKRSMCEVEQQEEHKKCKKVKNNGGVEVEPLVKEELWLPPTGQTGDGRTHLNEKLGY